MIWPEVPIGELCELVNGRAFKPTDWTEDGIPIVRIQNLNNHDAPFNRFNGDVRDRFLIDSGELLFSWSGTPGTSFGAFFWHRGRAVLNQHIFRVLVRDGVDANYFRYTINARIDTIIAQAHGGVGLQHITKGKLEATPLPLPPLSEQRRIAEILDKADAIRRKRQVAIAVTEQFLRSAFLEMFGDPATNPKHWPIEQLMDVSTIGSGVMKGKNYADIDTVERPYMRVANVQDGYLALNDIKMIEFPAADAEKYTLRYGDVLLTEGGDPDKLGRGAIWRDQIAACVHQNHIFRVRPDAQKVTPEYLSALLGSAYGKCYFLRAAKQTTGIASINRTQLSDFPVILPSLELQREYSRIVGAFERTCTVYKQCLAEAEALFNSLVQRAFAGQL